MVSITISLDDRTLKRIEHFPWINWSEIAREEILKKEMFERYLKTGKISDEDWKFCKKIDWHPVDWLPLKKEFVRKLEKISKKPGKKFKNADEFNKWCSSL